MVVSSKTEVNCWLGLVSMTPKKLDEASKSSDPVLFSILPWVGDTCFADHTRLILSCLLGRKWNTLFFHTNSAKDRSLGPPHSTLPTSDGTAALPKSLDQSKHWRRGLAKAFLIWTCICNKIILFQVTKDNKFLQNFNPWLWEEKQQK